MTRVDGRPGLMGDQEIAERVGEFVYSNDVAARMAGIKLIAIAPGSAITQMEVIGDMANAHGICHGGMIFMLADCAFAYAANSTNRASVAASSSIEFMQAGKLGGVLTAQAAERANSARNTFIEVLVTDNLGNQIALYHGRAHRLKSEQVIPVD